MEKRKILSKLNINFRDYNNELEKILENKLFSYDVKNLLLSMLYKIETAYKDYKTVKVEVPTKEEYIENLLRIIKEKAIKILLVKIGSDEAKELEGLPYKIDKKNGEIVCFQNEMIMLEALLKLDEANIDFKPIYDYIKEPIDEMLNQGKIDSNLEVTRDFNGWSWDIAIKEIRSIEYNFIFQNLLLLYGKDLTEINKKISENIIRMTIKKYIADSKYREKINEIKKHKKERLMLFENKKEFIEQLSEEKKEHTKKIEKIDKIINNNELLKKEYFARNEKLPNKEKIFSVSYLVKILEKEREELLEKINECNKIILPKEFVEQKQKLEKEVEFVSGIFNGKIEEDIVKICKEFLEIAEEKINRINEDNKDELIKWIYKIRYYRYIPISYNDYVKDIIDLEEDFTKIIKLIIKRAQSLKIWETFTEDFELTYIVLKEIFNTKIINLEAININFSYENKTLHIEYFDDTVIENTKKIEIENVKIKKKVKLFI